MNENQPVTVDDVLKLHPYTEYNRGRVTELFAGRRVLSALDVLDLDIPWPHRWGILARLLPIKTVGLLVCDFAWHALPQYEQAYSGDRRVRKCITTTRRYWRGKASLDTLKAAWGDAWAAAMVVARAAAGCGTKAYAKDAALAACKAAEHAAEWGSAYPAERRAAIAAWAAENAAEWVASYATEEAYQQRRVRDVLRKGD